MGCLGWSKRLEAEMRAVVVPEVQDSRKEVTPTALVYSSKEDVGRADAMATVAGGVPWERRMKFSSG